MTPIRIKDLSEILYLDGFAIRKNGSFNTSYLGVVASAVEATDTDQRFERDTIFYWVRNAKNLKLNTSYLDVVASVVAETGTDQIFERDPILVFFRSLSTTNG